MPMATADDVIRVARGEIGYSRYDDPLPGTKYGRWYAELTGSPYFGTTGVPFCAMGVSWVLARLGVSCRGFPTASCTGALLEPAWAGGYLIQPADLRRGDAVLFDWAGRGWQGGNADHVGLVVDNLGWALETVEFNVADGAVAERTREMRYVVGGIRPYYEEEEVTDADIAKIAEAVWAKRIDYKNGIDESPHTANARSRLGYIDYITHTILRKLDEVISLLKGERAEAPDEGAR